MITVQSLNKTSGFEVRRWRANLRYFSFLVRFRREKKTEQLKKKFLYWLEMIHRIGFFSIEKENSHSNGGERTKDIFSSKNASQIKRLVDFRFCLVEFLTDSFANRFRFLNRFDRTCFAREQKKKKNSVKLFCES